MTLTFKTVCILLVLIALVVGGAFFAGCTTTTPQPQATPSPTVTAGVQEAGTTAPVMTTIAPTPPPGPKTKILLATTTSLYDTGLLDYLKPMFDEKYNVDLLITSQGTGKAIEIAKRGDCDILAVHSPSQELTYMESGSGVNRRCFAYNYFIIVGPANDPAGVKGMKPEEAFKKLRTAGKANSPGVFFVSRGDNSGTHSAEKNIWKAAGLDYAKDIQKSGNWYIEAGRGMGETLQLASEKQAYTITDEGTYLAYKGKLDLVPVIEQGDILLNVYSVITVYTSAQPADKITMANNFVNFLISPEIQTAIAEYGKETYGKNLFSPMNGQCGQFKCDCTKPATGMKPMLVFNAGSLNTPFAKLETAYEAANPTVDANLFGGGSSTMIEKITKGGEYADVLASADSFLIPKMMEPAYTDWYAEFAKNQMVIAYTDKSNYADKITQENWYEILNMPDVTYVISDPNTDPAGYRAVMTVQLAERVYGLDTIFTSLLGSHGMMTRGFADGIYTIDVTNAKGDGKLVIGKDGPDVISRLKNGEADYAIEYSSVVMQNNLPYITLPGGMDLSDQSQNSKYATVKVKRKTATGTSTETGTAIIYGVTVPKNAMNRQAGIAWVKMLLDKTGQDILSADGQTPIVPAKGYGNVPAELKGLVV